MTRSRQPEFEFVDDEWLEPETSRVELGRGGRYPPERLKGLGRLAVLVLFAVLLIVLIIVAAGGCKGAGRGDRYRRYFAQLALSASASQRLGQEFSALMLTPGVTPGTLASRLGDLALRAQAELARAQALAPPASSIPEQDGALQAFQLRVAGLQGLRDALRSSAGSERSGRNAQVVTPLAGQVDRLLTSDVVWQDLVIDGAVAELRREQIGGVVVPRSRFLSNPTLLDPQTLLDLVAAPAAPRLGQPSLRLGDHGAAVRAWQLLLNRWVALHEPTQPSLVPDGSFGQATDSVTRAFQKAHGLTPDGIVGRHTRQALTNALARSGEAQPGRKQG